ncbi:MAG: hypothetical protein V4754_13880 [Pseudomonadota bacterium]
MRGKFLDQYLMRDIELGIAARRFRPEVALATHDIILGLIFFGIETLLTAPKQPEHVENMLFIVLHGMGLPADEARAIAFMPLPPIGAISAPIFSTFAPAAAN